MLEQESPVATAASTPHEALPRMLLLAPDHGLLGEGAHALLSPTPAELGGQVARHFAQHCTQHSAQHVAAGAAPPSRLLGALPFDPTQRAHLLAPQRVHAAPAAVAWLRSRNDAAPGPWDLNAEPSRAQYQAVVAEAVARIRGGKGLRKAVLARTLLARSAGAAISPWWLAQRLGGDPGVLRYVLPLPVAESEAPAWLVGATPERLLSRRGAHIVSSPLAGSAARGPDLAASEARAQALLQSAKDQGEHRYVVQAIGDLLAPLCRQLQVPRTPGLHATDTMWHLGTRIEGELKDASLQSLDQTSSAALAALLHPTPAVGGTPRAQALATIAELEPQARGFYAGAVGWCDARGDGDWYVSLRCARVQGRQARLFAGAGIVADSEPEAEGAETRAKFNAMLLALGLDAAALAPDL